MRHTFNGDARAEKKIDGALAQLRAALESAPEKQLIRAVLLGGGYGRGEGGATADGELSNDLDFFVVPQSGARRLDAEFWERIAEPLRRDLGIDVDFYAVPDSRWLAKNAETLMVRELAAGHEIVFGDASVEADLPPQPWSDIPRDEGARLFLNRGAGLLLARLETQKNTPDRLFIFRNIIKSALGCGDAILIARHAYRRTGTERAEALAQISVPDGLTEKYRAALAWKYRPALDISMESAGPDAVAEAERLWKDAFTFFTHTVTDGEPAPSPVRIGKNILLSLRHAPNLLRLGALLPLRKHPRVKLLRPLARIFNGAVGREQLFLKLWRRFS